MGERLGLGPGLDNYCLVLLLGGIIFKLKDICTTYDIKKHLFEHLFGPICSEECTVRILESRYTGCPQKNAPMRKTAKTPTKLALGIKVGGVLKSSGSSLADGH